MIIATGIFFAVFAVGISTAKSENDKELQFLHVIMRHGIRTPASTYPNDPYINHTFHPIGWGQVTNLGKLNLYNTGKFLRERYDSFLGGFYTPDLYYTQSTDVDRTKVSMQLVNAGLWPPGKDQKWGSLEWQPIPVHSEPLATDSLLLVRRPCAQYSLELKKVLESPEIKEKWKQNEETFKEVTRLSGQNIKDFEEAQDIFSTLLAEETFGLKLPDWTKGYYPDKLLEPTIFSYIVNAYNDKMNKLKGGVLLKKLMSDWKGKVDGTLKPKEQKAILYGGHDSTIVNILQTLKAWDPQLPGYGITILLELSKNKNTGEYGVEVFLRNSTDSLHQLTIGGCDKFCPLKTLEKLTENVIPVNWEKECESDDPNYVPPPPGQP